MSIIRFNDRSLFVADELMEETLRLADRAARSTAPVLLCGESGTGKELIARYIHEKSARRHEAFVSVNCAAIPEGLLEAELFGHERGAFTGAIAARIGKFEAASRGTLLLDEISEMPVMLQAKLLRVLQEREVDRLGGKRPVRIATRVIATTNRDPLRLVEAGVFREDLFYRLNVIRIDCSPLRGRREAICNLAIRVLKQTAEENGVDAIGITPEAMEALQAYSWPGNIRELQNVMQRAFLLSDGENIAEEHLSAIREYRRSSEDGVLSLAELEKRHIMRMLELTGGNRTRAAELLGITSRTLRNKLKLYRSCE